MSKTLKRNYQNTCVGLLHQLTQVYKKNGHHNAAYDHRLGGFLSNEYMISGRDVTCAT